MKLLRSRFADQLDTLRAAVAKTAAVRAFSHVWFDGKLARAYNGSLGIVVPLATEFRLGVPGHLLHGVVQNLSASEVELAMDGVSLQVKAGRSKVLLPTLPRDDMVWEFPAKIADSVPCVELSEAMLHGLRQVLLVKPKKPQRVEHHGVILSAGPGALLLYTTDSRALARALVPQQAPTAANNVVLPRAFVEQLVAHMPAGSKLYFAKNCLCARGPRVHIYANLLDNTGLVNMDELVRRYVSERGARGKLPAGLDEALRRAVVVAARADDAAISLEIKDGELLLSADYPTGSFNDAFDLGAKMDPAKVAVELGRLRLGLAESDTFEVGTGGLALHGKGFLFLMAGRWVPERPPLRPQRVSAADMDDDIPF